MSIKFYEVYKIHGHIFIPIGINDRKEDITNSTIYCYALDQHSSSSTMIILYSHHQMYTYTDNDIVHDSDTLRKVIKSFFTQNIKVHDYK